jgi:hypothetical protein
MTLDDEALDNNLAKPCDFNAATNYRGLYNSRHEQGSRVRVPLRRGLDLHLISTLHGIVQFTWQAPSGWRYN